MAVLTPVSITRAGVDNAGAASDVLGDQWANTGKEVVEVNNGSGAGITVTLVLQGAAALAAVDNAAVTNPTVTVPAGKTYVIGPFQTGAYNDANGLAKITYSAVTTVKTKVLRYIAP